MTIVGKAGWKRKKVARAKTAKNGGKWPLARRVLFLIASAIGSWILALYLIL